MPRDLFARLCVAMLATSLGTLPVLAATTDNWTGGSGNWSNASNWTNTSSGHTVPTTGDTVDITGASILNFTVTYDYTGSAVSLNTLTLDQGGSNIVSHGATLSMAANNLSASLEVIGDTTNGGSNGRGTFNQSGGVNNVLGTGGLFNFPGALNLGGEASDLGTYNLSGNGVLQAGFSDEVVGYNGRGNFNQTGGSNTTTELDLGLYTGANGTYTISGGTATVYSFVDIGGSSVGSGGVGTLNVSGTGSFSTGSLEIYSAPANSVTVDGGSLSSNSLDNEATLTATKGMVYAGGVTCASGSTLGIGLGGTTRGTNYGAVVVTGGASLAGTLEVSLTGGFTPAVGNTFDIFDWGSTPSGTFSSVDLPTLGGRIVWDSSQLYTTGTISVVATYLAGDFNRDGHVDAADILPMEQALSDLPGYEATKGLTPAQMLLIGDINGDGQFTGADLQAFLIALKSGGGSADPVPEPASWILAFLALAMVSGTRFSVRCVR